MTEITKVIKHKTQEEGFDLVGITEAEPLSEFAGNLQKWLQRGFHADMDYMSRNFELRINPMAHLKSAKSVIMLGVNYFNKENISDAIKGISIYARGHDYHHVLKEKIKKLLRQIKEFTGSDFNYKIFVDSSPVLERALAYRAGLGQFGKNSCLINKRIGSYFFLCGIIIDLELEYDKRINDPVCGKCTRCIDACPTGAIVEPYVIDSRLCISYHTIENRKEIPDEIARKMNGWIFGCDICQDVCPWNRKAGLTTEKSFIPEEKIKGLTLQEILNLNELQFYKLFSRTPVMRAGWSGFIRNARIALRNSHFVNSTAAS